ncbi:MAG TPA: NAD(P)/FAD-dependent oxidoreductase [Alphaproteobacteria bacterium]|nr:NAD(P)/FAD-dependent oxidoreductase [Alphaproteobacteria bacterium]
MVESVECVVIGAGVVGLAVARRLARAGREVLVLEAAEAIGTGISSRNSEVIHAGIYYPKGSLKARLCVAGKQALYRYCASRGIGHRRLGKLIVATDESELPLLDGLRAAAAANGVDDLVPLDRAAVRALEPAVRCAGGLFSPSTGVVDSHALMLSLRGEAEDRGAALAFHAPVTGGAVGDGTIRLEVGGAEAMALECRALVNAAGLDAPAVALCFAGVPASEVPRAYLAKGNYYGLAGRSPFTHLIYPVPVPGGLGTHVTLDLAGRARFGPDVEWVETRDYRVDPARAESFYAAIRRYWPDLPDGALQPDYAGIRPKITAPGAPAADFVIQGPEAHGIAGLVNLFGIESPGLTAALAIADHVAALLGCGDAGIDD